MLKLGITERRSFTGIPPAGAFARFRHALSKSRVSFDLLRMPSIPSAEDIDVFERLMPYVRLSSGVYRTTRRGRFRNLDPLVNSVLAENFKSAELRVEDWAASDCLTSFEWAQSLFPLFPALRFVASDTLLFLVEAEDLKSGEQIIFEPGGKPLQYIRPPFVVRMEPREPWFLPVNRILCLRAERIWGAKQACWTNPDWSRDLEDGAPLQGDGYHLRKLPLVHPEAAQLARANSGFAVRQHSIFDMVSEPCHAIRLMNILNRAYFSEELLTSACRNLIGGLLQGGICIIGRTVSENPPEHHATIFRKLRTGELETIRRVGSGSEIESLALAAGR